MYHKVSYNTKKEHGERIVTTQKLESMLSDVDVTVIEVMTFKEETAFELVISKCTGWVAYHLYTSKERAQSAYLNESQDPNNVWVHLTKHNYEL